MASMLTELSSRLPVRIDTVECVCPICTSEQFTALLQHESFGFLIQTVECSDCGLVYANPRPSLTYLKEFYDRRYRFFYEGVRKIDEAYIRRRRLRELAATRLARYKQHLRAESRVLDVGCGLGLFLDQVRANVPASRVVGIDPDSVTIEYCRNELQLDVHQGFLQQYSCKDRLDAISVFHIIEHVDQLHEFMAALRCRLEPGGLLFIETPNCYGLWEGIGMFHLAHLQTFSTHSLGNLIRLNGFEVVDSGAIENELECSNLFLIARATATQVPELLPRDAEASALLRRKCRQIRSIRAIRLLRTWAKLAYYSVGGQQP